ncbi:ATP-binding cassette domain-containing protein [Chamaesiphon sp. GL140_3_metabinner_50]|uniref:ABC transporter ATP-binding protein n=1 Tax=Chamaesiphon sp. GL140_3_metabinner_50 TaxID=2970812 RepID=UPI0025D6B274|nr:ATP-binding cassette domain-containing protein [Chamaesiphon sp. GL140_3_metabinner_50]
MEPIIQLRGVSQAFGNSVILDSLDLDIYPGQGLGVIGPSGTGKSTILRIIAGLLTPDEGEVYIRGELRRGSIEDGNDPIYIGMVFQQAALFDSLTVEENVGFRLFQQSRISRKHIRELVDAKLALVGMAGVADRYPAQLSGGMRKRVSFARAIMANPEHPEDNPEVLLYDEPTAGLDPIASTVIEDLVRDLQNVEDGCSTYVMVTHQNSTIRRTTDRIVFLYQGKVQWDGKTEDIDTTDNPLIRQFFSANTHGPIHLID